MLVKRMKMKRESRVGSLKARHRVVVFALIFKDAHGGRGLFSWWQTAELSSL